MGVSFKVSRTGTRFRPNPQIHSETIIDEPSDNAKDSSLIASKNASFSGKLEGYTDVGTEDVVPATAPSMPSEDNEVSFTLNLFHNGYSIGRPSEATLQDVPKLLHPYDRRSENLFSAIECGRLPAYVLDDIPCKYVDGSIVCEVRDYRMFATEQGSSTPFVSESPIVNRVCLRMSLENVVKDIPLISDDSWTYGDLMEVESEILKALQPKLLLDPIPMLDRLCNKPVSSKLNLDVCGRRKRRLSSIPEVTVTSSNKSHGKKVCIDRVPESSNGRLDPALSSGNARVPVLPLSSQQPKYQTGFQNQRNIQDHMSGSTGNVQGVSSAAQDMNISYTENLSSGGHLHGKNDNLDGQLSPLSSFKMRTMLSRAGTNEIQQQQIGPPKYGYHGSELNRKNILFQQQTMARGMQYPNTGIHKYSQQMLEGVLNPASGATSFLVGQHNSKQDVQMVGTGANNLDLQQTRLQQELPQQAFMRSSISQTQCNNLGQHVQKDSRKEEQLQRQKSAQSPLLSAGSMGHSPLSSKSGEFSGGSVAPKFAAVATTDALGSLQKDKAITSGAGGTSSLTSSSNNSMQHQHHAQVAAKRQTNSLPNTLAMTGIGSSTSGSTTHVQLNASSPSIGNQFLADKTTLERFSKIQMITSRRQLNCKKNKVDVSISKHKTYSTHHLSLCLNSAPNDENFKDDANVLSKSIIGGSMNVCKTRVLNFVQEGNAVSIVHKLQTRMIMSEKSSDGTVAMHYGDIDDGDILPDEEYLSTLPNTHLADLLAEQFTSLMRREGYVLEDHLQRKPTQQNMASTNQISVPGILPNTSVTQTQQPCNEVRNPMSGDNASQNSSLNMLSNTGTDPPGNSQAGQISQGLLTGISMPSGLQQLESQQSLQHQQQHHHQQQNQPSLIQQRHPHFQRSSMMLATNPLSHLHATGQNSNVQLGNHLVGSNLHLQMLQQQQQAQQPQMQRKMAMGLGTAMGAGNMGNNMAGLGGLGNAMSMGGVKGVGGIGVSSPMGPISAMGNMGQNPMLSQASNLTNAISQQLRAGTLTQAQAAAIMATKLRMMPNRSSMLGGPQSGMVGMSGARQMQPGSNSLSMLGQSLNRGTMSSIHRSVVGHMDPPKMTAGMNFYMNQQQQQLQLLQQQETISPLQDAVSSPHVGSPSMGIPQLNPQHHPIQQLQNNPQHMNQRTPMSPQQMSSGAIPAMSAGNMEACPASPQLSSQTHGSVGSIANSPMELQGVNKSNSASNS